MIAAFRALHPPTDTSRACARARAGSSTNGAPGTVTVSTISGPSSKA